jgi:NAD(P)-dependent dehydrogenase (short-subunit alcohol dehydrogenase family)
VVNLVRSLAAAEGGRGVRVNAVLSARPVASPALTGSAPLTTFPGRVDVEIAGAVRMLLSDDSAGITGTALVATGSRA